MSCLLCQWYILEDKTVYCLKKKKKYVNFSIFCCLIQTFKDAKWTWVLILTFTDFQDSVKLKQNGRTPSCMHHYISKLSSGLHNIISKRSKSGMKYGFLFLATCEQWAVISMLLPASRCAKSWHQRSWMSCAWLITCLHDNLHLCLSINRVRERTNKALLQTTPETVDTNESFMESIGCQVKKPWISKYHYSPFGGSKNLRKKHSEEFVTSSK